MGLLLATPVWSRMVARPSDVVPRLKILPCVVAHHVGDVSQWRVITIKSTLLMQSRVKGWEFDEAWEATSGKTALIAIS